MVWIVVISNCESAIDGTEQDKSKESNGQAESNLREAEESVGIRILKGLNSAQRSM